MSNSSGVVRERVVLTNRTIEALRPEATPYRISDLRCAGLAVRVSPNGLITWDLAFRIKGAAKVRRTSLGRYPHITLDNARDRATELTRAA